VSTRSPARTCPNCDSQLSEATQLCPVCMFRQALAGQAESGESSSESALHLASNPGTQRFEHYEVQRGADGKPIELGSGAMSVTYKAFDSSSHAAGTNASGPAEWRQQLTLHYVKTRR
jgi:hypothetical protein